MDRISKPSSEVLNNEDSDSSYHSSSQNMLLSGRCNTTSILSTIQSLEGVIISRSRLPHLQANTSNTPRDECPNLTVTYIIEHIGNIFSGSQNLSNPGACTAPFLSLFLFNRFHLSRIPRGLPDIIHRSLLPDAGSNSGNRRFSSQLSHASVSLVENGRQQYVESVLSMYRLADSMIEGSMSLMILAADTEVNSRLVSQDCSVHLCCKDLLLHNLHLSCSNFLQCNPLVHQQDIQAIHQSRWFNITETQDHYRDMRLDVDNMSYEELLALEDHIGNVSTGLSEEGVIMSLRHSKFYLFTDEHAQKECCSICQEDYEENDELGTLICGHVFHTDCIKQWLRCKNLCPICKSTGLDTTYPSFSQSHSQ